jgi:SAM-dependent methyltransferase
LPPDYKTWRQQLTLIGINLGNLQFFISHESIICGTVIAQSVLFSMWLSKAIVPVSDIHHPNRQYTNRDNLMKNAYVDERHLEIRIRTHDLYTVPKYDFQDWVLSQHAFWRGNEQVLDLGCGMGDYFEAVLKRIPSGRYFAADLSEGMLKKASSHPLAEQVTFFLQDAQALAFPDHTFDIILANHMLYHIPDLHHALDEIHRVLKPNGVLITAVNSQFTMLEFNTLTRRALTFLGHPTPDDSDTISKEGYSLENGSAKLSKHFRAVVRYEIPSALVFHDSQPVIDYLDSTRSLKEDTLPNGVIWEDYMMVMANQVDKLINHFGELVVNKLSGVLLATDGGGFAEQYLEQLDNQ